MARPKTDENTAAAVARLAAHPDWEILTEEVKRRRDVYFKNFAQGLAKSRNLVDQREVDEKRGFWIGAIWALDVFPKQMTREDEKNVEEALSREAELREGRGEVSA